MRQSQRTAFPAGEWLGLMPARQGPLMGRFITTLRGFAASPALIMMDEPTNHLDMHSIEALERALDGFGGALVLVSHDAAFMRQCMNATWEIRSGVLQVR